MTDKFVFSKALPVWAKGKEKEVNLSLDFHSSFEGKEKANIIITANSLYMLKVNGKFIGYGPARAAHGYYRIDRYALDGLKDKNEICIEAVGYNSDSFYTLNSTPFVQFEVLREGKVVLYSSKDSVQSKESKRLQKVLRFSYQRTFTEYYDDTKNLKEFPVENLKLDATYLERGVDYPTYDEEYSKVVECGKILVEKPEKVGYFEFQQILHLPVFPVEELERDPSKDMASFKFVKQAEGGKGHISSLEYEIYKLDASETGFIGIKLNALKDSKVYVVFDEVDTAKEDENQIGIDYTRNTTYNIICYEVGCGEYENISFEPYTAQFLRVVVVSGEIEVESVKVVKYENPVGKKLHDYDFGDVKKNLIAEAAVRTFAANSVDVFTDCPSRERAGWLCDSFFSARVEMFLTGDNKVERNFLENIAMSPKIHNLPEGMIPMCYPSDVEKCLFIPNWSLFYLVQLKDCLDRTGDRQLIDFSKNKVDGLIRYFQKFENEDSLLENLENWVFIEWSKANDADFISGVNYPSNMLYAYALDCVAEMYPSDYGNLSEKAERIRKHIRENSYNGEFFEDNAVRVDGKLVKTGHTTETCQYYAFFFGTATKEQYPDLYLKLVNEFGPNRDDEKTYPLVYRSNSFVGNYLRLDLLRQDGRKDQLLSESIDFFYKMAVLTGTLWEHSSVFASLNHCFASYILVLMDDSKK